MKLKLFEEYHTDSDLYWEISESEWDDMESGDIDITDSNIQKIRSSIRKDIIFTICDNPHRSRWVDLGRTEY